MFHPQLDWKSDRISAGSTEPIGQLSSDEISFYTGIEAVRTSLDKKVQYKPLDQTTMLIQVTVSFSSDVSSLNSEDSNFDLVPPEKSRRTPVRPFNAEQSYFVKMTFNQALPAWLTQSSNNSEQSNNTFSALEQLILAAGMQSQLVSDFLFLLSDPLTNLCPRPVLQSKIAKLSQSYSIGLVMLHCIDFHQINKKFGHQFGDTVIQEIATNLKDITREGDILCRFGGALFGVAFPVNEQTDVASLAKKLQRSLQQKQYLEGAINLIRNSHSGARSRIENI
ncbi:GGDEF domain-containing protein [Aliiglaciecola sp. NS0011-25]|uniref:GGDEF domain-containing protein n=1 Tax=Aliiglaciecola sp. NS0011-25 TaxID=3127654 RepID=UPI0031058892